MAVPTVNAANAATVMIAVAGTGGRTVVPVGNVVTIVVTIVGTIAGMIAVTGARAAKAGAAPSAPTAGLTAGMTAAGTAERAAGQTIAATHSAPAQNGTASDIPPRSAPGSVRNG